MFNGEVYVYYSVYWGEALRGGVAMNGNVKRFIKKGYESLNRNMLQDVDNLSLQAIGLLSNLTSMPDGWTIRKTELYKRYAKNGRTSVQSAWNELVDNNYIVQLRKRVGRKFEYIYYYSQEKFSEDDIKKIEEIEGCPVWDGKKSSNVENQHSISNVDFGLPKMDFPKSTSIKLTNKEINYKDKELDTTDTETADFSSSAFFNSLTEQEREKEKQKYMENAFYANKDHVPERIAHMLRVFSTTSEQANEYYKIILQAKKSVEDKIGQAILLEDHRDLEQGIINSFSRAVRKIEKDRNIENESGYIYQSIFGYLSNEIHNRMRKSAATNDDNSNVVFYDWLEK